MGQRSVTKVYDATSAAGGSIDSGAAGIETERHVSLLIQVIASGAAAPASVTVSAVLDGGALANHGGVTVPGAGGSARSVVSPSRRTRFQATGGASSTVRLVVFGVRD